MKNLFEIFNEFARISLEGAIESALTKGGIIFEMKIKLIINSSLFTWRIRKVMRFDKKFCTSDNQFFIKFWILTFSTMEILNPKVGTMPRKFEKYLWLTNRLAQFLP